MTCFLEIFIWPFPKSNSLFFLVDDRTRNKENNNNTKKKRKKLTAPYAIRNKHRLKVLWRLRPQMKTI